MRKNTNTIFQTAGTERTLCVAGLVMAFIWTSASAQVNSWISPTSGNWDQPAFWSLGVLPDSSQSVMITNSLSKTVAINPTTPVAFPDSMTVGSLTILGATDTENRLLLNLFGTAVPLTVLNGLTLGTNAQILNLGSALVVEGGAITMTNAQIGQDGGVVVVTNATMRLSSSEYDLTNGVFEGGQVELGTPISASFNQYGGTVNIAALSFGQNVFPGAGGNYSLYGGNLNLPGGLTVYGDQQGGVPSSSSYLQAGGTNRTTSVYVYTTAFSLNGGLLADDSVVLIAGSSEVAITQNGGAHMVTNTLSIIGGAPNGNTVAPATYTLNGGTLSAGSVELDADEGDSVFVQSNATTSAGTIYAHSLGFFSSHNTIITLAGGTLGCSNYTTLDGGGRLNQSGGALVVSNLLDFGGSRNVGRIIYGAYTFTGGTLSASNISITGDWIIGDGGTNRISNSGFFSLSHTLTISNAVEQLGSFILASNATIDLAGSASQLSFANSSGGIWASGATLMVADWNGNLSGGGAEQLKFGTDTTGLTSAQLSQIQFANPAGLPSGTYPATILFNGEVVPQNSPLAPAPFFAGEVSLGSGWYYLANGSNNVFGYYNTTYFPYVYHLDLGWEYFQDANNAARGGYFYDFTDSAWFYTEPNLFPFLYDFKANAWLYYQPQADMSGRYTSNPRWFYNFSTQAWTNHL